MLHRLNFNYDEDKLLEEFEDRSSFEYFFAPHKPEQKFDYKWLIKKVDSGYGKELANYFSEITDAQKVKPRFMIQMSGYSLGFHKDTGTACSINFVCNSDPDPINFRHGKEYYKCALLNTQEDHAVLETTQDRFLFKISIFDKSYEEVRDNLISNGF